MKIVGVERDKTLSLERIRRYDQAKSKCHLQEFQL